jgi:hypothetical protein
LARLREAAQAADWTAVREELAAVPDGEDLTRCVAHVSDVAGVEEWIAKAVESEPESALARLVAGARGVTWAWEARTGARAEDVSRERFEVFFERLGVAEEHLYEAAEREPEWVAPWYFLLITGRGLQVDPEPARLRFEAAVRRCPGHPGVHRQRLQQVCRKWGGSHEEMHAFARESMLRAPEGSGLGELVAIAHIEHWLDLDEGEDMAHIRSPRVIAELHEAADRSVRHPAHVRTRGWTHPFNAFAMAFALAGEKQAAAGMFQALQGRVTEFPWYYLDSDPVRAYRKWSG